jgi:NAD(P)-dependent dehydrogenase (short-subunit alcohol dehydrogenase family)
MKLDGKVAIVTGSARGLGWEIIQALAQEGAKVVICDLTQSDVDEAVARLKTAPENVLGVKADVTSERDVGDLFSRTLGKFNRLDVVVNNAGFAWPRGGPVNLELAETPADVWCKVLDTNLNGTFLCSREALKIMRPAAGGVIINISSPQGKKGKLLRGPYTAAKFGVEGLTQVLALENESYRIRANCLDPGGIVATEAIRKIPVSGRRNAASSSVPNAPMTVLNIKLNSRGPNNLPGMLTSGPMIASSGTPCLIHSGSGLTSRTENAS